MARPKKVKLTEDLKAIGVTDLEKRGNQVDLYFDPQKTPLRVKKSIAAAGEARELAKASNIMYNDPRFPTFFEKPVGEDEASVHDKIQLAQYYFKKDPLVGKIIEIMKTFANDGFVNQCKNKEIKDWYDHWNKVIELDLVFGWIFLEYFMTGNVIITREMINYRPELFKALPDTSAKGAAKKDWTKKQIPIAYSLVNPLLVQADESVNNPYKDRLLKNESVNVKSSLKDPAYFSINQDESLIALKDAIKNDDGRAISDRKFQRILRMRLPYESYGHILMERAFNAIYEKNKMRQLDLETMNSYLNQIVKVTVGNDAFPATPRQLKSVAQSFQNSGKSQIIFWNHTLQVEIVKSNNELMKEDRYERIDSDIRNAFGISEILLGGGGSKTNFATSYLSLKAFITNLLDARKDVLRWLDGQYKEMALVMGFDEYPIPQFTSISLTDEIAEKQLIMQLVDRGIISYETAQLSLGYDNKIEIERKTVEQPLVESGILGMGMAGSPYQQSNDKIVNSKKEVDSAIKIQDKKSIDNRDKKENQRERLKNQSKDPSVQLKGMEGRPKGQGPGKKFDRKIQKIKGQGEIADILTDGDKNEE